VNDQLNIRIVALLMFDHLHPKFLLCLLLVGGAESFVQKQHPAFSTSVFSSGDGELPEDKEKLSRRRFLLNYVKPALFLISASTVWTSIFPDAVAAKEELVQPSTIGLFEQFQTVDNVPKDYFTQNKKIYAFVERIIDGDTFRVRHYPGYSTLYQTPEPLKTGGIADLTLKIRLYGVDTPEIAKNKSQISQPFAQDAKDFTKNLIYHKMVQVTFLRKDQYSRAICQVETLPTYKVGPKDVSVELTRAGLAELYTGAGAVYAGQKGVLETSIRLAKEQKVGVWSLGDDLVTAKEAKACIRSGANVNSCYRDGAAAAI
jgi:endonuclease YncB( thermonuclease family)